MKESEIIDALMKESSEYQNLEEEHKQLEGSLDLLLKKKHLTPEEEVEKKKIQKQKLQCKDRMAELVRGYK